MAAGANTQKAVDIVVAIQAAAANGNPVNERGAILDLCAAVQLIGMDALSQTPAAVSLDPSQTTVDASATATVSEQPPGVQTLPQTAVTEDVVNVANQAAGAVKPMRAISFADTGGVSKTQQVNAIGGVSNAVADVKTAANSKFDDPGLEVTPTTTCVSTSEVGVAAGLTTVKGSAGRLYGACVNTSGSTTALNVYDSSGAAAGTKLFSVPVGAAIGPISGFPASGIPFANGLVSNSIAGTPDVTFYYS